MSYLILNEIFLNKKNKTPPVINNIDGINPKIKSPLKQYAIKDMKKTCIKTIFCRNRVL